jgi:hypothetical protein
LAVGAMLGTLLTLIVYDYLNGRCVYAACLAFAGFLNLLTPAFAEAGGFYTVVIFRGTLVFTRVLLQCWRSENERIRNFLMNPILNSDSDLTIKCGEKNLSKCCCYYQKQKHKSGA